jgi:hypothetical protein
VDQPTLRDLRARIERLAAPAGHYRLVCARTGECPVPAAGNRFETRAAAVRAARTTHRYRERLRSYDPRVRFHDLIVCQEPESGTVVRRSHAATLEAE